LLADLPYVVAIRIVGHLAVTSERHMDKLHNLRATYKFMRHVCGDRAVGRRVALERFSRDMA
jgi:hypothetical protein